MWMLLLDEVHAFMERPIASHGGHIHLVNAFIAKP